MVLPKENHILLILNTPVSEKNNNSSISDFPFLIYTRQRYNRSIEPPAVMIETMMIQCHVFDIHKKLSL